MQSKSTQSLANSLTSASDSWKLCFAYFLIFSSVSENQVPTSLQHEERLLPRAIVSTECLERTRTVPSMAGIQESCIPSL